jgi:hypothetical protein
LHAPPRQEVPIPTRKHGHSCAFWTVAAIHLLQVPFLLLPSLAASLLGPGLR